MTIQSWEPKNEAHIPVHKNTKACSFPLTITEYAKNLYPEVWLCNCLNINTLQHQKVYCETGFSEDEEEEGVA